MHPTAVLDDHGGTLREVGEALYDARASLLAAQFEGYVADTYYVAGVGHVCWPAITDGRFDAYDTTCPAEERALAPLLEAGFERVAVGLSRVVVREPGGDHVVKLARCGMGDGFGDGRRANLVEAALSPGSTADAPVVPSLHCEPRGTFAVYPDVGDQSAQATGSDHEGSVEEVRDWLGERAPWLDLTEAVAPDNRCVWRGRLRTLDYSSAGEMPLGVPAHADPAGVVAAVDEQRRAGAKRDLRDGGGFVDPEVE